MLLVGPALPEAAVSASLVTMLQVLSSLHYLLQAMLLVGPALPETAVSAR